MDIKNFENIVKKCSSKSDVCNNMGFPINGTGLRKVNEMIEELNIDITHFDRGVSKRRKYQEIEKDCPICETRFKTRLNHKKEKTVCSRSCANTYFRRGIDNPNYKNDDLLSGTSSYRIICFRYHEKKCVCCEEKNIVEVHHHDNDKNNNKPENLVPLCPTHHSYWHSKFRNLIKAKVEKYIKLFKEKNIE